MLFSQCKGCTGKAKHIHLILPGKTGVSPSAVPECLQGAHLKCKLVKFGTKDILEDKNLCYFLEESLRSKLESHRLKRARNGCSVKREDGKVC